jgi:hypothetical protein
MATEVSVNRSAQVSPSVAASTVLPGAHDTRSFVELQGKNVKGGKRIKSEKDLHGCPGYAR